LSEVSYTALVNQPGIPDTTCERMPSENDFW
jgi:hypothetical protein